MYAQNTDGLAAILSHEMAHFILGHRNLPHFSTASGYLSWAVLSNLVQGFLVPPRTHYEEFDGTSRFICFDFSRFLRHDVYGQSIILPLMCSDT